MSDSGPISDEQNVECLDFFPPEEHSVWKIKHLGYV